ALVRPGPGEGVEAAVEVVFGAVREVVQQMMGELAPAQLAEEGLNVGVQCCAAPRLECGGDAPWRDLAEMQVRRQARTADAIGPLALFAVAMQRAVEEDLQRFARPGLAGRPVLPETGVPAARRRQPQHLEPDAVRIA